jgi:HAD superfamily phosphoserine phosphatase-like hydrolase
VTGTSPRYLSVALDVDSTLCGIEGIDWLATLRDDEVAAKVAHATGMAMRGEMPLENLYGNRMELVSPKQSEIRQLSDAYRASLSPGAKEEIAKWRSAGVEVVLVSGGLRAAIGPVASELGFDAAQVNALDINFDSEGVFSGFDESSPLYTATGKRRLLQQISLPRPLLAVGDGITDLAMKDVADAFVAFTGFVSRDAVIASADFVASSFEQLTQLILGD